MVRTGGEREGAAVPKRRITEGATVMRLIMIILVGLITTAEA